MSLASGDASGTSREQRKLEREERKRRRAAQDSTKMLGTEKKTSGKDDKRTKKELTSTNGAVATRGHRKQSNNNAKRLAFPSYDKVNIVEKTAKFNGVEKEKGKQKTEVVKTATPDSSGRRKLGDKFLDNLSKFEAQTKEQNEKKKTNFVRSYSNHRSSSSSNASSAADSLFRRSYRPSRTTPTIDDPSIFARRSLRKERVSDSIAKLERKSSNDGETLLKRTTPSPIMDNGADDKSKSAQQLSAGSSKSLLSDSGSSTSSNKGLTRAQQAIERHRMRMRSSSQTSQNGTATQCKPASPSGKTRSAELRRTPKKSKAKDKSASKSRSEEPSARKISVSTTSFEGDIVEVTTVTEVTTSSEGKMNVVVKELTANEEDTENLVSPFDGPEYQLEDLQPMSVGDAVAAFDKESASQPAVPLVTALDEKQPRVRRKLPQIPTDQEPVVEPKSHRRHSRKKKQNEEDGSGEPNFKLEEREVVVIETSPTFEESSKVMHFTLDQHSSPDEQNCQLSCNTNFSANSGPKLPMVDKNLLVHEQKVVVQEEQIKSDENVPKASSPKEDVLNQKYDEEAIKAFERLSEEIHSQPAGTKENSSVTKPCVVAKEIIKEDHPQDRSTPIENRRNQRPLSLHIEEVLYIEEETRDQRPKSISPLKRSIKDITQTPSPQKSPAKFRKSSWEARDFFEHTSEVVSPAKTPTSRGSRTPPSQTVIRSLPKTPESPTRSPLRSNSPEKHVQPNSPLQQPKSPGLAIYSPVPYVAVKGAPRSPSPQKSFELPLKSPTRSESPTRTPSPVKRAQSPAERLIFQRQSFEATPLSPPPEKIHETITKIPTFTPTPVRTPSLVKHVTSPIKEKVADAIACEEKPEIKSVPTYPVVETPASAVRTPSPVGRAKSPKKEMLATRAAVFAPRYKKSWIDEWLDESDDDNASLLSAAASDASSIDLEWLGSDTDDDGDYEPKQRNAEPKKKSTGAGLQRSASSAQDMMKMWEKKAVEKKRGNTSHDSPKKVAIESTTSVGDARATWESKNSQSSVESTENGSESPEKTASTPSTPKRVLQQSSAENSLKSKSNEEESKEMQEIFGEEVSGKIQGAKALFENLIQSPKRSPSIGRSPRKRVEPRSTDVADESPTFSRKSSISENVVTSRKSSISQASESSDVPRTDSTDGTDEAPCVDNMRAMFESQGKKKPEVKKNKTSLAEMVADDECDVTDVRSIKAMWESMDNGR